MSQLTGSGPYVFAMPTVRDRAVTRSTNEAGYSPLPSGSEMKNRKTALAIVVALSLFGALASALWIDHFVLDHPV